MRPQLTRRSVSHPRECRVPIPMFSELTEASVSASISTLRCAEYDSVARSLSTPRMPHITLAQTVFEHEYLAHLDWRHFVTITMPEDEPERPNHRRLGGDELSSIRKHMKQFHDAVVRLSDDPATTEGAIMVRIEQMTDRLTRYPLGCRLDAAISVVDNTFMDEVALEAGPDFAQEMSFLDSNEETSFHLPLLLVAHQTSNPELDDNTRNLLRLCCVSAAHFLAVLGIKDFPVFGLATVGHHGYVSAAWSSDTDGVCTDVHKLVEVSDLIRRCSTLPIGTLPSTVLTFPRKRVSFDSSAFCTGCRSSLPT